MCFSKQFLVVFLAFFRNIPIFSELHAKVLFPDVLEVLPRTIPMMIYDSPQKLSWDRDEIEIVSSSPDRRLVNEINPGVNVKTVGGMESNHLGSFS